jgi:hypothetical protein
MTCFCSLCMAPAATRRRRHPRYCTTTRPVPPTPLRILFFLVLLHLELPHVLYFFLSPPLFFSRVASSSGHLVISVVYWLYFFLSCARIKPSVSTLPSHAVIHVPYALLTTCCTHPTLSYLYLPSPPNSRSLPWIPWNDRYV